MSDRLNRPTVFLFTLTKSWNQQTGRRYDLQVRGFFSLAGALHHVQRWQLPAGRSWIADHAPKGWIATGVDTGKVIRRHSVRKRPAATR